MIQKIVSNYTSPLNRLKPGRLSGFFTRYLTRLLDQEADNSVQKFL